MEKMFMGFLLCVFLVFYIGAEQCYKFRNRFAIRSYRNYGKTCVNGYDGILCKYWRCPDLSINCRGKRVFLADNGCPVCDGICCDDGQVYVKGKTWRCSDGSNTCSCLSRGKVSMSKVMQHPEFLCPKYFENRQQRG